MLQASYLTLSFDVLQIPSIYLNLTPYADFVTYTSMLGFLDKESLPIITQLHVQIHWWPINLDVNLQITEKKDILPGEIQWNKEMQ